MSVSVEVYDNVEDDGGRQNNNFIHNRTQISGVGERREVRVRVTHSLSTQTIHTTNPIKMSRELKTTDENHCAKKYDNDDDEIIEVLHKREIRTEGNKK